MEPFQLFVFSSEIRRTIRNFLHFYESSLSIVYQRANMPNNVRRSEGEAMIKTIFDKM